MRPINIMAEDTVSILKNEIIELTDLFAEAIVKRIHPVKDELSRGELGRLFGECWAQKQIKVGRLKGYRKGAYQNSPIIFSRVEAMALKEAEKRGAQMIRKQMAQ